MIRIASGFCAVTPSLPAGQDFCICSTYESSGGCVASSLGLPSPPLAKGLVSTMLLPSAALFHVPAAADLEVLSAADREICYLCHPT